MEIPFDRWYSAILDRHSRRKYDPSRTILPDAVDSLKQICAGFRPFPGARAELVNGPANAVFKGILGSYGKVKDAPAFLAFIGDSSNPHFQEAAGYTGEAVILEATSLGLGTCWVGGFFRPDTVAGLIKLAPGERVLAVSPAGYTADSKTLEEKAMSGFARSRKRKPLSDLVTGLPEDQRPSWVKDALEAARLAPSAMNRQPWRFEIQDKAITISSAGSLDFGVSYRLDCGIAMLHLEVAALKNKVQGRWEFLAAPQVARFVY